MPDRPRLEPNLWDRMPKPRRWWTSPLIPFFVIVIVVTAGILNINGMMQPVKKTGPYNPVGPPANTDVFMDVKNDTTIVSKKMNIQGDIIVRDGTALTVDGCNITMNGTFYVSGKLEVRDSVLQDGAGAGGFICDYGGYTLALLTNLTGSKHAVLNFTAKNDGGPDSLVELEISEEGSTTAGVWQSSYEPNTTERASVDLSRFSGKVAELRFISGMWNGRHEFDLIAPKIMADDFSTLTEDLIVEKQSNDWHEWRATSFQFPCRINSANAEVVIENSTWSYFGHYGPQTITAANSHLRISNSSFLELPQLNGAGSSTVVSLRSGELEMDNCTLTNGLGIWANDSTLDVRDSVFSSQYCGIIVTDSDLAVERCRFEGCTEGIMASASPESRKWNASVSDTTINGSDRCIGLDGLTPSITGCRLTGGAPVLIYPPDNLSRSSCTMENIAKISGNIFTVVGRYYKSETAPAVTFFSAFPITDLDSIIPDNVWNASEPVARYILLDWPSFAEWDERTELFCNYTGLETALDENMHRTGTGSFQDGWVSIPAKGYNDPFYDFYLQTADDFSHRMPVERIYAAGNGYRELALDESALQFRLQNASAISIGTLDARTLAQCQQVLQLSIPQSDLCDVQLSCSGISCSPDLSFLNITVNVNQYGAPCADMNYTATLGGEDIGPDQWSWTDTGFCFSLGTANLTGGELVVSAFPFGPGDENLSNNELRIMVRSINGSATVDGKKGLSGVWLLQPGVDITFTNCTFRSADSDIYFFGMGQNRLIAKNCSFNASKQEFDLDSGSLEDSDFESVYSYSLYGTDYYTTGLFLDSGSWRLDNITGGCRAADFPSMRSAILLDPMDYINDTTHPYGRSCGLDMMVDVESLAISNSSILCGSYILVTANSSVDFLDSTFIQVCDMNLSAPNISLEGNRFEMLDELVLGGNVFADRNEFRTVFSGVTVRGAGDHCVFTGNDFSCDAGFDRFSYFAGYQGTVGLVLSAAGAPTVDNNSFTHFNTGILTDDPTGMQRLSRDNSFALLGLARVFSMKTIDIRVDAMALSLQMNRALARSVICWNDTLTAGSNDFYENDATTTRSWEAWIEFADHSIDANGTERWLYEMNCTLAVSSPSGAVWSHGFTFAMMPDDMWTEYIG